MDEQGQKKRLPGDKCEDCGKPLEPGDDVTFTEDSERFWHTACFNANLTPFAQWPRKIDRTNAADA